MNDAVQISNGTMFPSLIAFDVTSRCNLNCAHCYNDSGTRNSDLSSNALLSIAHMISELHPINVCLCGGEPLLCDCLIDILDILNGNVGSIGMVSNGFALTKPKSAELVAHGLNTIQISLDGAYAWQHDSLRGVSGSFERAKNAIIYLIDAKINQCVVSITPNKLNCNTLEDYVLLCRTLGVQTIRSMPFVPSGRAVSVGHDLTLDSLGYFRLCREFKRLTTKYGLETRIEWDDPLSEIIQTAKQDYRHDMIIRSNGDIALSMYLPIIVGNCTRHSLKEYWLAGYNSIWRESYVAQLTQNIKSIDDLCAFEPQPFSGASVYVDTLDKILK